MLSSGKTAGVVGSEESAAGILRALSSIFDVTTSHSGGILRVSLED